MQAARDKDGVFLPKEVYEENVKAKEFADKEIQEKTLLLKAMEEEMEKFKVSSALLLNHVDILPLLTILVHF